MPTSTGMRGAPVGSTLAVTMTIAEEWERAGRIIDQCNELEDLMKAVIEAYVAPSEESAGFFRACLLNNSIVSLGSKIKLIQVINKQRSLIKLDQNQLHRLIAIRNAFAHNDLRTGLRFKVQDRDALIQYVVMESIKGDGSIQKVTRDEAAKEFAQVHKDVKSGLKAMLRKLRGDG